MVQSRNPASSPKMLLVDSLLKNGSSNSGMAPPPQRRVSYVAGAPKLCDPLLSHRLSSMTVSRLQPYAVTIFAEMSALAARIGAVNLGQGFPDEDGPPAMLKVAA